MLHSSPFERSASHISAHWRHPICDRLGWHHFLTPHGDTIRFVGSPRWWTVRAAASGPFAIVTQQAPFYSRGVLQYAAIDFDRNVRGPVNIIGGGWGDGSYDDAACWEMLALLLARDLEVTHRNPAPLRINGHREYGAPCSCAEYDGTHWPSQSARPTAVTP